MKDIALGVHILGKLQCIDTTVIDTSEIIIIHLDYTDTGPKGWVILPNSKVRIGLYRFPMQLVFNFTGDIVLIFLMIPNIEMIF